MKKRMNLLRVFIRKIIQLDKNIIKLHQKSLQKWKTDISKRTPKKGPLYAFSYDSLLESLAPPPPLDPFDSPPSPDSSLLPSSSCCCWPCSSAAFNRISWIFA